MANPLLPSINLPLLKKVYKKVSGKVYNYITNTANKAVEAENNGDSSKMDKLEGEMRYPNPIVIPSYGAYYGYGPRPYGGSLQHRGSIGEDIVSLYLGRATPDETAAWINKIDHYRESDPINAEFKGYSESGQKFDGNPSIEASGGNPIIEINIPKRDRFNFEVQRSEDTKTLDFSKTNYIRKNAGIDNDLIDLQRVWGTATPYTDSLGNKYFINRYADPWDFGGNYAKDYGLNIFRIGEGVQKAAETIGNPIIFQSRPDTIPVNDFTNSGFRVIGGSKKSGGKINYQKIFK